MKEKRDKSKLITRTCGVGKRLFPDVTPEVFRKLRKELWKSL